MERGCRRKREAERDRPEGRASGAGSARPVAAQCDPGREHAGEGTRRARRTGVAFWSAAAAPPPRRSRAPVTFHVRTLSPVGARVGDVESAALVTDARDDRFRRSVTAAYAPADAATASATTQAPTTGVRCNLLSFTIWKSRRRARARQFTGPYLPERPPAVAHAAPQVDSAPGSAETRPAASSGGRGDCGEPSVSGHQTRLRTSQAGIYLYRRGRR